MRRVSITDLKAHLIEYVDAAKAGEEIIVTDRQNPVARLGPIGAPLRRDAQLTGLIRAGLARPAVRSLSRDFWERPRPRDHQARAMEGLIDELKEGR